MPKDLKAYKVFIASPGGLKEEREAFRDEINSYNESEAAPRGVLFDPRRQGSDARWGRSSAELHQRGHQGVRLFPAVALGWMGVAFEQRGGGVQLGIRGRVRLSDEVPRG
jgi:hypothetical protein